MQRPLNFACRLCASLTILGGLLLGGLGGCNAGGGPDLGLVSGTVTLDGQPVSSGIISFVPDETRGSRGPVASAIISTEGRYTLHAPGRRPGAVIGFHKVAVACPETISSGESEGEESEDSQCSIPAVYASEETSPITVEVTAGNNTIDVELKSTP